MSERERERERETHGSTEAGAGGYAGDGEPCKYYGAGG